MASVAKRKWTHKGQQREAWVVRYKDKGSAHRSKQFDLKKDADGYKRKVENELEAGTHIARSGSVTVAEMMEEFAASIERKFRDGQASHSYVAMLNTCHPYITKRIGQTLLLDLTWQAVEQLSHDLRKTKCRKKDALLSPRFVKTIIRSLGTAVAYGVRRGYVSRNVIPDAVKEIGPVAPPRIETFSKAEVKHLFQCLETRHERHHHRTYFQMRAMIYIAAVCGLRKGEIAALTWKDIDAENGVIRVRHGIDQIDRLGPPKTKAGVRTVPLPWQVAQVIEDYRPYVVEDARGLIFRTVTGRKLVDVGFYKIWYRRLSQAGLRVRNFHALRHFAGSAWLAAGLSLPEVSRLMGHSNTAITAEIYAHAISEPGHQATQLSALASDLTPRLPAPTAQGLRIAA